MINETIGVHIDDAIRTEREACYQAARGSNDPKAFEKFGASQLYWKGRSDAATAIRERNKVPVESQESKCDNCPFAKTGRGAHLQRTLNPEFWQMVIKNLTLGNVFHCHKTTDETGNGTNLVCAGALEWQHRRQISPAVERLAAFISAARKNNFL